MDKQKQKLWLLLVFVLLVAVTGIYGHWQNQAGPVEPAVAPPGTDKSGEAGGREVVIYLSGAVNKPGVYKVPADSRIIDAINRAGGLAPGADSNGVNMAQLVSDGLQVKVPGLIGPGGVQPPPAGTADGKVNINTADKTELDKLPGVGPVMAEKICQYRQENGLFRDISELKKVSGIGEAKYNKLKDKITI